MRNQLLSRVPYPLRLQVMPSKSRISSAKTRFQERTPEREEDRSGDRAYVLAALARLVQNAYASVAAVEELGRSGSAACVPLHKRERGPPASRSAAAGFLRPLFFPLCCTPKRSLDRARAHVAYD